MPRPTRRRGFTLIEIMVVIVILGVLAALVVPRVLERPDDARAIAAKSDIATIMQALKLYRLDNQRYPTGEQGLTALVAKPEQPPGAAQLEARRLPGAAAEGSVGTPVLSTSIRACSGEVDVFSFGADGQPGGTGIDADIGSWDLCSRGARAARRARQPHATQVSRWSKFWSSSRSSPSPRASRSSPTTAMTATAATREAAASPARSSTRRARAVARRDARRFRGRRRLAILAARPPTRTAGSRWPTTTCSPRTGCPTGNRSSRRCRYAGQALDAGRHRAVARRPAATSRSRSCCIAQDARVVLVGRSAEPRDGQRGRRPCQP